VSSILVIDDNAATRAAIRACWGKSVNTRATLSPTTEAAQRIDVIAKTYNVAGSRFARNVTPPRKWIHPNNQRPVFGVRGVTIGCDFTLDSAPSALSYSNVPNSTA